ncbi:MAG TPA: hypothetical protein ENK47_04475 [Euryarchaeota archaeon]|nr:hypothetical protein [Euryarchaeota archaeon]
MAGDITVVDDFEGAMISTGRVDGSRLFMGIRKEPVTKGYRLEFDYNLHFHFGIRNAGDGERTVEVLVDSTPDDELARDLRHLWVGERPDGPYRIAEVNGKMNDGFPVKYRFGLSLPPNSTIYVANFPPIPYDRLRKDLESKAERLNARRRVIGTSEEGREIVAYELGDVDGIRPLVFAAGYHPPEEDPVSISAIFDLLMDDGLRRDILKSMSLVFLPVLNPDGFANYMQGSNINGMNFHWHFFDSRGFSCREARVVWEYLERIAPSFFMDFHAFTFQSWDSRPYNIPVLYCASGPQRDVQRRVNGSLRSLCGGRYSVSEKILAPDLLVTALRRDLGTVVSPKFHVNWQDGPEGVKELSREAFEAVVRAFDGMDPGSVLFRPRGGTGKGLMLVMRWRFLDLYYLHLRPVLGRIKGKLSGGGGKG